MFGFRGRKKFFSGRFLERYSTWSLRKFHIYFDLVNTSLSKFGLNLNEGVINKLNSCTNVQNKNVILQRPEL